MAEGVLFELLFGDMLFHELALAVLCRNDEFAVRWEAVGVEVDMLVERRRG